MNCAQSVIKIYLVKIGWRHFLRAEHDGYINLLIKEIQIKWLVGLAVDWVASVSSDGGDQAVGHEDCHAGKY